MNEEKIIKFTFARIVTEEFAILRENYDSLPAVFNVVLNFGFNAKELLIGAHMKGSILVQNDPVVVIGVNCQFRIHPELWATFYAEQTKTLTVPKMWALHFGSLTLSTTRGILHAKTERFPINALVIPPIDVNDFVKTDLVMTGPQSTPEQVSPPANI